MTGRDRPGLPFELLLLGLAAFAAAPVWWVDHPPIQDLPQHLAAMRALVDYDDPALRFSEFFTVELSRTQYLAYYLVVRLLALPFGVLLANKIVLTLAIVGTPYAMRALLAALGRDVRACLIVLPLTWNAHLILGFLNFIAAIPLALLGLALAARLRRDYSHRRAVALAVVAALTFYTHVVPFGFLGLGAGLIAIGDGARATLRRWWPLLPATFAALAWSRYSPAGQSTLTAALLSDGSDGPQPQHMSWPDAVRQAPSWLTDVLHGDTDDQLLVVWAVLVLATLALGAGRVGAKSDRLGPVMLRRVAVLAPVAALSYFITPASYDWIWPINARFPLLALVFLVPALPFPRGAAGWLLVLCFAFTSARATEVVVDAFADFEAEEIGELDDAIAAVPEGSKVAGLIFDRGSRHVKFSPFIHSVAWLQAERGGAAMFTFADFPQSPIRFREDNRPPRVRPRWEWTPERVDPRRDLEWYDYVLVRGGPGRISRDRALYEPVFRGPRWSVWRRVR